MKNWKCDHFFYNVVQFVTNFVQVWSSFPWSGVRYATKREKVDSPFLSLTTSGHSLALLFCLFCLFVFFVFFDSPFLSLATSSHSLVWPSFFEVVLDIRKVVSPFLSLATSDHFWPLLTTHSLCRRGKRCSHPSSLGSLLKTTSGSNNQKQYSKWSWSYLSAFPISHDPIFKSWLPSSWSS